MAAFERTDGPFERAGRYTCAPAGAFGYDPRAEALSRRRLQVAAGGLRMNESLVKQLRPHVAEFIGTFALVFVGCGTLASGKVDAIATLPKPSARSR